MVFIFLFSKVVLIISNSVWFMHIPVNCSKFRCIKGEETLSQGSNIDLGFSSFNNLETKLKTLIDAVMEF